MNTTQRLTISLPEYLYQQLAKSVGPGRVSGFIAELLEKELLFQTPQRDPVEMFVKLRRILPKKSRAEIQRAIERGRV